ncbi:UPF0262 family protein [Caulobacter sp. RL271]|uniref:UPF0262 protein MZV50_18365 n=1 Tax=Caulobacter segnis TaxID=88688 RepID=A0ABY4ZPH7_9CAUL|nr:UPF0262 family protein [Caulobacter segnis]USQ94534.1 UPF0262 family protein [Caulobacter segnis]
MSTDDRASHKIKSIEIDEDSLAAASRDQEQERQVAIFDLLEGNYFEPADAPGGPYDIRLSLIENRLAFDIRGQGPENEGWERRHLLSLSPFRSVIRDYFMICDSYYSAIRNSTPQQIEALDMGRRGLHNEGSNLLRERLDGKVKTDLDTARRLFTLICALHWRG